MRTPNAAYATSQRDPVHFKRALARAVLLPLVLTALLSVLFLWQIGRLLAKVGNLFWSILASHAVANEYTK